MYRHRPVPFFPVVRQTDGCLAFPQSGLTSVYCVPPVAFMMSVLPCRTRRLRQRATGYGIGCASGQVCRRRREWRTPERPTLPAQVRRDGRACGRWCRLRRHGGTWKNRRPQADGAKAVAECAGVGKAAQARNAPAGVWRMEKGPCPFFPSGRTVRRW